MEPWHGILLVLIGVLVGAIVPVLIQAAMTLRSWRSLTRTLEPRIAAALDGLQRVAQAQAPEPSPLTAAVSAAVGPAVVALVHAWRAQHEEAAEPAHDGHAGGGASPEVLQ